MIIWFTSIDNFEYFDGDNTCYEKFRVLFGMPLANQAPVGSLCFWRVIVDSQLLLKLLPGDSD